MENKPREKKVVKGDNVILRGEVETYLTKKIYQIEDPLRYSQPRVQKRLKKIFKAYK